MTSLTGLLRQNRNYRYMWLGQVVSEAGDYFNNVAVLALVMEKTGSGMVVSGVFLSRAIPAVLAGPIAGVVLDRFDRRRIMIASDLVRALVAAAFVFTVHEQRPWLLYLLSAVLMFVSPFFTAGRAAILPSIAGKEEIHAANSLTQTTSWATLTAGTLLGGFGAAAFGYDAAFLLNAFSFLFSAWCIAKIAWRPAARVPAAKPSSGAGDFMDGLRYIASVPLMVGIALISFGWALGGGAAQVLFALFGEQVFHRGATGIGDIWGFAGLGLLAGGMLGHLIGRRTGFAGYKRAVTISYMIHGAAYMLFSRTGSFGAALIWMMLSRVGMAVTSILNNSQLLHHTAAPYRGRVFATIEALRNAVMIVSMAAAGIASQYAGARLIALIAGSFGLLTAFAWAWLDATGRLPEPPAEPSEPAP